MSFTPKRHARNDPRMKATHHGLSLAALPEPERAAAVAARLAELKPGDELLLVSDCAPDAVLPHLQTAFPDGFDWWPLERGPSTWRVLVQRREADGDAPRTITNLMCADHGRLDKLYGHVYRALEAGHLESARALLAEFETGLKRHVAAEEEILMPLMAERGGPRGPRDAEQMHEEHQRIVSALEEAVSAVALVSPEGAKSAIALLTHMRFVLEGHNQNEERLLYPIGDRETDAAERADTIARIQAL